MSLTLRLLAAARHAYEITGDGPVADTGSPRPYALVGYIAPPQGFRAGMDNQDGGFVASIPEGVLVSIRGTTPPSMLARSPKQVIIDWACDALAALTPPGGTPPGFPGRVHFGFYKSFMRLWQVLGPAIHDHVSTHPLGSQARLYVTGHSKGGAVCALVAWRLKVDFPQLRITVRAFAPARVGDARFAAAYNRTIADHVRYEYDDDVVPHLPLATHLAAELGVPKVAAALLSLVDPGYGQVGALGYIMADGSIAADTPSLTAERAAGLIERFRTVEGCKYVVACHAIGPNDGYAKAAYPD